MKQWLLYQVPALAVTLVLHFAAGLTFGLSAFIALIGWPLVGVSVTADDYLPGGWSNPDGDIPPPWRTTLFWGQLAAGCGISSFVAALEAGIVTSTGMAFVSAGLVTGLAAIALLRHHCRSNPTVRH